MLYSACIRSLRWLRISLQRLDARTFNKEESLYGRAVKHGAKKIWGRIQRPVDCEGPQEAAEAICYAANEAYRTGKRGDPRGKAREGMEAPAREPQGGLLHRERAMDDSTILARLYGKLVDVARTERASTLFVGSGGLVSGRIARLNDYLGSADEALSASEALMARSIGLSAEALGEVLRAETAQEAPLDGEEDNWMEGVDND